MKDFKSRVFFVFIMLFLNQAAFGENTTVLDLSLNNNFILVQDPNTGEAKLLSLQLPIESKYESDDCLTCNTHELDLPSKHKFSRLEKEIAEIISVGISAELLAATMEAEDKKGHVKAGAYIAYFSKKTCELIPKIFDIKVEITPTGEFFCALTGATIAGLAKEYYDSKHPDKHTVDKYDAMATSLGAVAVIPALVIKF